MKSNKTLTVGALLALSASCAFAQTPEESFTILRDQNNVEVAFGYMTSLNDELSVDSLLGAMLGISYTFDRTEKSSQNLSFTVGLFTGDKSDSYTVNHAWAYGGDIDEKFDQTLVPVMVGYKYNYNVADDVSVWAGARVGIYISKTEYEYERNTHPDRIGANTLGLSKENKIDIAPTIGLNVGGEYQFADGWSWMVGATVDLSAGYSKVKQYKDCAGEDVFSGRVSSETLITTTIYTGVTFKF